MNDLSQQLDEIDRALLRHLQQDGRATSSDLGRKVNLSQPAVHQRIKRLERLGIITGYHADINRERLGYDLLCYIHISLAGHDAQTNNAFREAVSQLPELLSCHHVTGDFDYILKVLLRNRRDLEAFILNRITHIQGIDRIQTSIVLGEVKDTTQIHIISEE